MPKLIVNKQDAVFRDTKSPRLANTKGKQTILFGGEFDYQNSPNVFLPNYNGAGNFGNLDTFLHQSGNFLLATGNPLLPFTEKDYALYLQDDYKVSSNLTLNLGLRWEFFGQAINERNKLTVARESNPATVIWSTALSLAARTTAKVNNDYKDFAPRFSFAFNPSFDRKLVVRGGYSIGYDPAFYNIFINAATVAPVATSGEFACNGTCLGSGNFTGAASARPISQACPSAEIPPSAIRTTSPPTSTTPMSRPTPSASTVR